MRSLACILCFDHLLVSPSRTSQTCQISRFHNLWQLSKLAVAAFTELAVCFCLSPSVSVVLTFLTNLRFWLLLKTWSVGLSSWLLSVGRFLQKKASFPFWRLYLGLGYQRLTKDLHLVWTPPACESLPCTGSVWLSIRLRAAHGTSRDPEKPNWSEVRKTRLHPEA
jgi:hypothetical protein